MRVRNKRNLYLDDTFGHEDSILKSLREKAEEEGVVHMEISSHEGRILHFLAQVLKTQKIVEIGSLYGYSTLYLSRALPEDGLIFTCDISEKRHKATQQILKTCPDYHKIRWITGKAQDTLKTLESEGPFDMVFIDADKGSYGIYLEWAEKNLRPGGLMAADNTFLFGAVYGEQPDSQEGHSEKTLQTILSFNQRVSESDAWTGVMIPTSEGLTLAIKK